MPRILILGGTTEGRELAAACASLPSVVTVSSLAGRTTTPIVPAGDLRIGGFGGVDGLASYLTDSKITAVVDATHAFASTMTVHAAAACARVEVPLLRLRRPGWTATPGDDWRRVPSMAAAADLVPQLGRRVFLTTGRQSIGVFAALDDCWFLARSVEPPEPPMPRRLKVILDKGPFTVSGELELLAAHAIEVLVTKDSGGLAPKLAAARTHGIPVVMVDRPPSPDVPHVESVAEAAAWIARQG